MLSSVSFFKPKYHTIYTHSVLNRGEIISYLRNTHLSANDTHISVKTHWYICQQKVNLCSGNSLVMSGNKPLTLSMLTRGSVPYAVTGPQ